MKSVKILAIAVLIFLITITSVTAIHVSTVSFSPTEWIANTDKDVSIIVSNNEGSNIVKVELMVPETSDENPVYIVKDILTPGGWKEFTVTKPGRSSHKIIWKTEGTGITKDTSLEFGITAQSPAEGGHEWEWVTTDSKEGTDTGIITTRVGAAPLGYLEITGEPEEIKAGEYFKATVTIYDQADKIKTDYTGTVTFTSTDDKAILPDDYTFTSTDKGSKEFSIKFKTAGNQTFTVKDETISQTSSIIRVESGDISFINIKPDDGTIGSTETIEFTATTTDIFDNEFDVTEETKWNIDEEAEGSWDDNIYTAEKEGVWTVTGTYKKLVDGTTLTVGAMVEEVPITEEIPLTEGIISPLTPIAVLTITGPDSITIAPGESDNLGLTVNNLGEEDLVGVKLSFSGVPSEWILAYPPSEDIEAGSSKDFLVAITIPENETGTRTITFTASAEDVTATKDSVLNIGVLGPTGFFAVVSKNLLQLGIIIIAVAAVVLIVWELWFRK